ncbi:MULTISPECIES: extracellular solute-binding protein [unclassified Streptomyces]|uniref:ABC transporter substrate-binding protein n=1 Tax=unclassified Streptomyces TaxID=2593676 RepID=UPI002E18B3A4|nr:MULTISPECIES: extracellular solute-binding protein [unclassified Streptomyces]
MRTRPLRFAALTASAVMVFTACSASGGDRKAEVTLWMYPVIKDEAASKKYWAKTETAFEKAHPDINLNIELQTFDKRDAQISAALAAGSGPDIVLITPDQAATYNKVGGLLPVDDAVADQRKAFHPETLKAATIDGKLYGVPVFQNINTTAYNTKIFADAGLAIPKTWRDVLKAAPVLAKKGIAVMDYAGSTEQTLNLSFFPLLWQAGGTVFSEDGKDVAFDSQQGVSALQFLVDLKKQGGLPPDASAAGPAVEGAPIGKGKAAMRTVTSLPELSQMRAALGKENVALGLPLQGKVRATYGNPGLLALTSINKDVNREAAYDVLAYLSSAKSQKALNAATGTFPTRTDVKAPGTGPDFKVLNEALGYANPGEPSPAARQVMATLAPYIQAALRGDLTSKEALKKAAEEARALLARS